MNRPGTMLFFLKLETERAVEFDRAVDIRGSQNDERKFRSHNSIIGSE